MINLKKEFGKKEVKRFEEMFQSGEYDLSYRARNNANIFHYAAACGDLKRVKELSELGADFNDKDSPNDTISPRKNALDYAALCGRQELVQWFIDQETDPQARKELIQQAMFSAGWGGHLELVQWLVSQGADIFKDILYELSVLHLAAWSGNLKLVQWLASKGMQLYIRHDFSVRPNFMHHDVMCFAALSGNLELVEWLVSQGVKVVSCERLSNMSVWGSALKSGSVELVEWLSKQKEYTWMMENKDDCINVDVLIDAASNGHFDLLKWLYEQGIGANRIDAWANKALLEAVKSVDCSLEMAQWLAELGADINTKDKSGKTVLDNAVEQDNIECAQWLASQGAKGSENEKDDLGQRLAKRGYTLIPLNNKRDLASLFFDPKEDLLNTDQSPTDPNDQEE